MISIWRWAVYAWQHVRVRFVRLYVRQGFHWPAFVHRYLDYFVPPSELRYCGSHTSLYNQLSAKEVWQLECGIQYMLSGNLVPTAVVFEFAFDRDNSLPVVAYAWAQARVALNDENNASAILQNALTRVENLDQADAAEWHLLKLSICFVRINTHGEIQSAVDQARSSKVWLLSFPLEDYSDVVAHCVLLYHQIMHLASSYTNWIDTNSECNVPPTAENSWKASVAVLRHYLQTQGSFVLLRACTVLESRLTEGDESLKLSMQLVEWARRTPKIDIDATVHNSMVSSSLSLYVLKLLELKRTDEAEKVLLEFEEEMEALFANRPAKQHWKKSCPIIHRRLQLDTYRVECAQNYTTREAFETIIGNLIKFYELGFDEYSVFGFDPNLAVQALQEGLNLCDRLRHLQLPPRDIEALAAAEDELLQRKVSCHLEWTGNMISYAALVNRYASEALHRRQFGAVREIIQELERILPEFHVPLLGERTTFYAIGAALRLDDQVWLEQCRRKRSLCIEQSPHTIVHANGSLSVGNLDDPSGNNYWREWHELINDTLMFERQRSERQNDWCPRYEKVASDCLLRWIRAAVENDVLSASDVFEMLILPEKTHLLAISETGSGSTHKDEDLSPRLQPSKDDMLQICFSIDPDSLRQRIFGDPEPSECVLWDSWLVKLEGLFSRRSLGPSLEHRQYFLKNIMQARCHRMANYGSTLFEKPIDFVRHGSLSEDLFYEAKTLLRDCIAYFDAVRAPDRAYDCKLHLARCHLIHHSIYKTVPPEECLAVLEEAEASIRAVTWSDSTDDGRSQLYKSQNAAGEILNTPDLYNLGLLACAVSIDIARDNYNPGVDAGSAKEAELLVKINQFVDWTQKAKSRAYTDLCRENPRLLETSIALARSTPAGDRLVEQIGALAQQVDAKTEGQTRTELQEAMNALSLEIRDEPLTQRCLSLAGGLSITSNEISQLSAALGGSVVFADWFSVRQENTQVHHLHLVTYKQGTVQSWDPLSIDLAAVKDWTQDQLERSDGLSEADDDDFRPLVGNSATRQLRRLDALVEPLARHSKPGDLIVLCPVADLYQLPLHALKVDGQVLICRNKIVFCPSLSVLRLCHMARTVVKADEPCKAKLFNAIPTNDTASRVLQDIGSQLNTTVTTFSEHPKEEFTRTIEDASMVHFHGHIRFDPQNPWRHHLCLRDSPETEQDILTAEEFFKVPFREGAHFTAISCKGYRNKVSTAQDLQGLTPALLYAGASSIISSLWNIHSEDGLRFSRTFYDSILSQSREIGREGVDPIDLALAFQQAVLELRLDVNGRVRAPYHWAGFVFNGSWLFPNTNFKNY